MQQLRACAVARIGAGQQAEDAVVGGDGAVPAGCGFEWAVFAQLDPELHVGQRFGVELGGFYGLLRQTAAIL